MKALLAAALLALLAGCGTVSESISGDTVLGADEVLVVGRIEIRPRVKAEEQTFKAGWDVFNVQRHYIGRALLFASDRPEYQERTDNALNPPLEETFFVKVPRSRPYIVKGSVVMSYVARTVSRRQVAVDQSELLFPAPLALELRPTDRAIYVGTLRMHRDEFHEVVRAEVVDDYARAADDFRTKIGGKVPLRKALFRLPKR